MRKLFVVAFSWWFLSHAPGAVEPTLHGSFESEDECVIVVRQYVAWYQQYRPKQEAWLVPCFGLD